MFSLYLFCWGGGGSNKSIGSVDTLAFTALPHLMESNGHGHLTEVQTDGLWMSKIMWDSLFCLSNGLFDLFVHWLCEIQYPMVYMCLFYIGFICFITDCMCVITGHICVSIVLCEWLSHGMCCSNFTLKPAKVRDSSPKNNSCFSLKNIGQECNWPPHIAQNVFK